LVVLIPRKDGCKSRLKKVLQKDLRGAENFDIFLKEEKLAGKIVIHMKEDAKPIYPSILDIKKHKFVKKAPEGEQHQFLVEIYTKIEKWDNWAIVDDFNTSFETIRMLVLFVKIFPLRW
jgi:hypothetical protein